MTQTATVNKIPFYGFLGYHVTTQDTVTGSQYRSMKEHYNHRVAHDSRLRGLYELKVAKRITYTALAKKCKLSVDNVNKIFLGKMVLTEERYNILKTGLMSFNDEQDRIGEIRKLIKGHVHFVESENRYRRLRQYEVAEMAGYSPIHLSHVFQGIHPMTDTMYKKLKSLLTKNVSS